MRDDLDEHYTKMRQDFDDLEYRLGGETRYLGLEVPLPFPFPFSFLPSSLFILRVLWIPFDWFGFSMRGLIFVSVGADRGDQGEPNRAAPLSGRNLPLLP